MASGFSSPSVKYLLFAATPTTVIEALGVGAGYRKVRPTALWSPNSRRARFSLRIATSGAPFRSEATNSRPARIGIPMVRK